MPAAASTATRSVCLVSLGCAKNLVDSEVMAGHLGRAGIGLVSDPAESDVVVVNTCGFIDAAREESIDTVLHYVEMKRRGAIRGVVVSGCLVQLHESKLVDELPEVDAFLPLSDYSGVPSIVDQVLGLAPEDVGPTGSPRGAGTVAGGLRKRADSDLGRALLTPRHTAYLRLGEGCNHVCAFCAIPKIRGKLKSKPIEVLVEEASALAALGAVELTLVAEDSTDYGKDLKAGYGLADLLAALGKVPGIEWVRVMYAHPGTIDGRLVRALAEVPNVLPYLDMPVQHGDEVVLRRMRRGTSPERIRHVVAELRAAVPDITLRTTVLVGFPGETGRRFEHLLELLEELRFDRVGCFVFSPEETTEAARLGGRPSRAEAERRQRRVMALQRRLLTAAHKARLGATERVLVDAVEPLAGIDGALAIARSARDAPEVDGRVLVSLPAAHDVAPGCFLDVRLTGLQGYDLVAVPAAARALGARGERAAT